MGPGQGIFADPRSVAGRETVRHSVADLGTAAGRDTGPAAAPMDTDPGLGQTVR